MAGAIKAEHINPFLRATTETFLSMVKLGDPCRQDRGEARRQVLRRRFRDHHISLPTVVVGTHHKPGEPSDIRPMLVHFESPLGPFNLIVSFRSES